MADKRRAQILDLLHAAGPRGLTWREIDEYLGIGHGAVSGVLSRLHRLGFVYRLTQTRNRCKVYLHPAHHTDDMLTERPAHPRGRCPHAAEVCEAIDAWRIEAETALGRVRQVLAASDLDTGQSCPHADALRRRIEKVIR